MAGFEGDAAKSKNAAEALKTERDCIYQENAPSGGWRLSILAPNWDGACFYADFRNASLPVYFGFTAYFCFSFGYNAPVESLEVRWNLPNDVCGLYLDGACYALLNYGKPQQRHRGNPYRAVRKEPYNKAPFNQYAIAWFCNEQLKMEG